MSEGINRVTLLGNLGADPELRMSQAGNAVLRLRLATTEVYFDRDKRKQERTEWHSVTVFGNRGEALSKILNKGDRILVEGRIQSSSYDDKDGQKRYRFDIIATNVILCGGGRGGAARSQERDPAHDPTTGEVADEPWAHPY